MNNLKNFFSNRTILAYSLLLPSIILLAIFMFYPIINVIAMSFSNTNILGTIQSFAGIANYKALLVDPEFWTIFLRTIIWTILAVLMKTIIGFVFAMLLGIRFKAIKLARTLLIIPWAVSVPITAIFFRWIYNSDFGLLNHTLKMIGINNPPYWLAQQTSAFFAVLFVDVWIGIPFMAIVFLAGLQSIAIELYEASSIDGANWLQKLVYVTLPTIRPVIVIATMLSVLWTFNDFTVIWIITKGGPMNSTDILVTWIYKNYFLYHRPATGAALGTITFLVLLVFSIYYARFYFKED